MFIVLLKFSDNRDKAGNHMDGHKAWIKQGFSDGVFVMAGSLKPGLGGCVVAVGTTLADLQGRVEADPFVAENVVTPEILEIEPAMIDDRLGFLKDVLS